MLVEKKTSIYLAIELSPREISFVVYVDAIIRAYWWRKNRVQQRCAMSNTTRIYVCIWSSLKIVSK